MVAVVVLHTATVWCNTFNAIFVAKSADVLHLLQVLHPPVAVQKEKQ